MSFINSIFLFATAAAALPVLYHLVRRMRAKTVPFGSLMFLKATPKELIRKRRLKDRLLMLARAALLALLALVFARPYLPAEQLPFVAQRESESVVVLIDRSLSMQYDGAFERALEAARNRIESAPSGDEFALVSFDDNVQVLSQLESDPATSLGALGTLEAGFRTTDFFPALQRANDVLQEATHSRQVVVMISDFQETGWSGALENWKLRQDVVFEPVGVGSDDFENTYIEAFELSSRSAEEGEAVRFDARIAAAGGAVDRPRAATLVIDGAEIDRLRLPGRASAPVSFQRVVTREGYYQGSIELESDGLQADDRYYFTDQMDGRPLVISIDAPAASRRDAFYLRNAFDLGDGARFAFASAEAANGNLLREADVVFLSKPVGGVEAAQLRRFVEEGGTVVVSPGDDADAAGLTATLQAFDMGRIEGIVDARDQLGYEVIIGEVETRHPIFQAFVGSGRAAILRPQFRRFARLTPADSTTVLGRFDSGDAFLAERSVGLGRVLFYASTLNTSWTDLPLDEMYVPLLYQLVRYGLGASAKQGAFTVGDPVEVTGAPSETVEVRAPGDRLYRVSLDEEGRGYFRDTDRPGHYAVASGSNTRFFSVNVNPIESDLRRRDAEEAYAAVVPPSDETPTNPAQAAATIVQDDERTQKLWRILLFAVLALFITESYFANRRTRSVQPEGIPLQGGRRQ